MKGRPRRDSYIQYGYRLVLCPGHPRAIDAHHVYVYEHILIAEKALGRPLEKKHPVHHFNEIKSDNANTNLVICEDNAYHRLLHMRQRVVDAGGDPNTQKICTKCHRLKLCAGFHSDPTRLADGLDPRCKSCKKIDDADKWKRRGLPRERAPKEYCLRGHKLSGDGIYVTVIPKGRSNVTESAGI